MTLRLLIDPGHGGKSSGIVRGDLVEKDINVLLACELKASLADLPIAVELTRETAAYRSLADRGEFERKVGIDFVISIHVNGHPTSDAVHGLETYHWPGNDIARKVARTIASTAPYQLYTARTVEAYDDPDTSADDWIQNPRAVLGAYRAPCVLAECGYATNHLDREYLLTRWGRAAVVCALRAGVVDAARLLDQSQEKKDGQT